MLKDQFHLDRKQMQGPPEICTTSRIITSTCRHTLASKITFTRKDNDGRNNIGIQGKTHHAQECICMLKGAQQSYPEIQFCLVSLQQTQILLIIFSKSCSYFPHGTCLLLDSIIYSVAPPPRIGLPFPFLRERRRLQGGSLGSGGPPWWEIKRPAKTKMFTIRKIKKNIKNIRTLWTLSCRTFKNN